MVDIKDTKKLVKEMAQSAPVDVDKVAKIKEAISSGKYPLDLDKLSEMAFNDPSTNGNPVKLKKDDLKKMYKHSLTGELF